MLEGRVSDLLRASAYSVKTSCFLSPAEQNAVFDVARALGDGERCFFWGGAPECERRVAVFLPDWMASGAGELGGAFDPRREEALAEFIESGADDGALAEAIIPLEISCGAYGELCHRDYLGALTALGVERDAIGEIVTTSPSSAIVFAAPAAAALIERELTSVGREKVTVMRDALPEGFRIEHEYETITDTVMSLRLDGIVRTLCKISRESAAELVLSGDVSVNYSVAEKPDAAVEKGDVISVRGYGKFIFDGDRGVNRRGRLRIDARRYV